MGSKKMFLGIFFLLTVMIFLWGIKEKATKYAAGKDIKMKEVKKIALTFDDGPSVYTEELLEGLRQRNVKVTFFVLGKNAEKFPEVVIQEAQDGHLIGNHTYSHVELTTLTIQEAYEEVERTNEMVETLTKTEVEYIRPPFGCWDDKYHEIGLMPVMWTVDPLDWATKNTEEIVKKVVTRVEENDIILLHDCYQSSVDAAFLLIDILQAEGFEFVTVEELLLE